MHLSVIAVFFLLLTGNSLFAAIQEEWLAVEGGTVFDGTGTIHQAATILISGRQIKEIGPASEVRIPVDAQRLDARGKFILPGFIDLHFHYSPRTSPWLPLHFLAQGVTTQREMGNWIEDNQQWLADMRSQGLPTPRLLYSGPLLDGTNPAYPNESLVLLDEMDARRTTNRLIDQGATSLKVYFRLPLTLMKAVIEEADRHNVPVHGHLEIVDARDAIAVGLDGIEHTTTLGRALLPPKESEAFRQEVLQDNSARSPGRFRVWEKIDPNGEAAADLIELMLGHEVNLDATLATFEPARGVVGNEQQWKAIENLAGFTVRYQRAGGSVTIGSHGTADNAAPGFAFHRELEMHVEAGMSPAAALEAATSVGAEALRLDDRGILSAGRLADLIILDADPLQKISNVTRIQTVVLGGKILDRRALLATRPTRTGDVIRLLKPWEGEEGLRRTFSEVEELAQRCRYSDCSHQTEPGCAVQDALSAGRLSPARFENYPKLQQELAFQTRRRDEHQAREEKQRTKSVHRLFRRRIAEKHAGESKAEPHI